tara:strand:+ start:1220 stop:1897 length:678 start_codon:yes stop_codon:yes gene_type:complete
MPFKSEKQRKWMWANDPEMAQEWEDEEKLEEEEEIINPKMSKKDLVEYINFKTKGGVKKFKMGELVKEQTPPRYNQGNGPYDFPYLNEVTPQERRDIMKYYEMLRQSGIINMFGSHPILNWTRDDLHRFLYGERNDPEAIEREIEEEEYDNEDGENDNTISILEDKLEKINYLLDNKRKIRDVLIRAALNRIENTDGNHETRNVQRIFEKMAKEAWHFWVGIQQI